MLSTLSNVAKRHPLFSFFVLAYALSWWPRIWYTFDPVNALPILDWGPLLAALIMLGFTDGKAALKTFLGRIIQWRVGLRWYALVLGLPALIGATAAGLNLLLGATLSATAQFPTGSDLFAIPLIFMFAFLWTGLGEEPAWRGYALPRLLVGRSALAASLQLGLLHVLWHLPQFGLDYTLHNGAPWAVGVIAYAVLTTWVYHHTQGSLLMPILFHAANNIFSRPLLLLFSGGDLLRMWWLVPSLWVTAAIIVVLMTGPNLVRTPAQPEVVREPAVRV